MKFFLNRTWADFNSVRPLLRLILIGTLAAELTLEFYLFKIPEWFYGASILGQLASKLSLSYIASFVFYYLAVHLKSQSDKRNAYEIAFPLSRTIIWDSKSILTELHITQNVSSGNNDEIRAAFQNLTWGSPANLLIHFNPEIYADWQGYLSYYYRRLDDNLKEIFTLTVFYDSDFLTKLFAIQHCSFMSMLDMFSKNPALSDTMKPLTLEPLAQPFIDYLALINDLETYIEKKSKSLTLE